MLPLHIIDAFASRPFTGNPAAVCVLDAPRDDSFLQSVAAEMNLSETAFLLADPVLPDSWKLRWFTPKAEVDLCGHATLASAHFLWSTQRLDPGVSARFHTKSGMLTCTLDPLDRWITMDFPSEPAIPTSDRRNFLAALNPPGPIVSIAKNRFDYLVELDSERSLRDLRPDFQLLAQFPVRGTIVTAPSDNPDYDFVSRFFAPAFGIDEDPVTGSAHCALAPFWSSKLGKPSLRALQVSSRTGVLRLTHAGPRTLIAGQAVTTLRAELLA